MTDELRDPECLFCRVVARDVPATIVDESASALAFRDINPQAPTHVLVVPKAHHTNAGTLATADPQLLADVVRMAAAVAEADGVATGGYRIVTNTGEAAGQSVPHVHLHVLGGRALSWPPG